MSELLARESSRLSTGDETSSDFQPLAATWAARDTLRSLVAGESVHRGVEEGTAVILGVASPALRCGLESLVATTPGMRMAASVQSVSDLVSEMRGHATGVALVDPFLGGHGHVRVLIDTMRAAGSSIRCVFITDEFQPHLVREAVKAGASGFVGASADAKEIRNALVEASRGHRYIAPAVAARLAESLTLEELTSREMDVLALLARGECNKTIARVLGVTFGTVKTHVRAIMCKLSSRSRTEAALKACRFGLVGLHS